MKAQDKIFLNHAKYLFENRELLSTPEGIIETLVNDELYRKYIAQLTEGFDKDQVASVRPIFEHQRQMILEDAVNVADSQIASAYAITYFPILADTYMDDILYKAITHHTTNEPIMTFPKVQLSAKIANSDGSVVNAPFPRARYLIRATPEKMYLMPKNTNNLFHMSHSYPNEVNDKLSFINKRFFIVDSLHVQITDTTSTTTQEVMLGLRPDSRGQINKDFEFTDGDYVITGSLIGNINWDKGLVVYSVVFGNGKPGHEYSVEHLETSVMFTARTGDIGRVKITMSMKGWDVNVDVKEDFEFDLHAEMVQEYTDIYNIDLAKSISEAIKNQILLNRDHDISNLLRGAEAEMKGLNTFETVDLQIYRDTSSMLSPGFLGAIFQTIAPRISVVSRHIYLNNSVIPQYILTGVRAAAVLEQLQEFAVTLPSYRQGLVGFDNLHAMNIHVNVFLKNIILSSPALDDDKLYLVFKPDDQGEHTDQNPELSALMMRDRLRSTILANIIYKPIYFIEEITNSVKRTFIRSRTALELFRPEGLGCINIIGMHDILTSNPVIKKLVM